MNPQTSTPRETMRHHLDALAEKLAANGVLAEMVGDIQKVIFRLIARPAALVLEVWDQVPAPPIMRQVDVWDESGRGLFLVHTLAARWSWKTAPDWPGKCVWAKLREPSQPLAREG